MNSVRTVPFVATVPQVRRYRYPVPICCIALQRSIIINMYQRKWWLCGDWLTGAPWINQPVAAARWQAEPPTCDKNRCVTWATDLVQQSMAIQWLTNHTLRVSL